MAITPPSDRLLHARNLGVGYRGSAILPPVDVEIGRNQFWALVGRNGSGKTTLLRTLLGLLPRVDGDCGFGPGVQVGYTPQTENIDETVPSRVVDIVASGLDRNWDFIIPFLTLRRRAEIEAAMQATQVAAFAKRQFAELSVGQKQRVLQARLLAGQPHLMILDEPTSAMDAVAERETFARLDALRRDRGLSLMVVSHHLEVLIEHATHILAVDQEQALVVAGTVEDVLAHAGFRQRYGEAFVLRLELAAHRGAPIAQTQAEAEAQAEADAEAEAEAEAEADSEPPRVGP